MEPQDSLPHWKEPAACPSPEPDHSSPCLPIPLLKYPSTSRSPHQHPLHISHLPPTCHMPCQSHSSLFDWPNTVWRGLQSIKVLVIYSLQHPSHLVPCKPKCLHQHLILEPPRPVFLPHCELPNFIPIPNKRQSYSSVYLDPCIFG
jgi:hypothetical protein